MGDTRWSVRYSPCNPSFHRKSVTPVAHNMYVDVRQLLRDGLQLPAPDVLPFSDDFCLFYASSFNLIYGDTESGRPGYALPLRPRYSTTAAEQPSSIWTTTALPR